MNKLQRVIALAKEAGGGRRLVGGDWIFTEQQLVAFFDAASAPNQPSVAVDNGWRETVMACGCIYRGVLTPFCPYHPATPVPTTEVQK